MLFVSEILDGSTSERANNGFETTMDMKRRASPVPAHHNSRQMNNNHHSTPMPSAPAVRIELVFFFFNSYVPIAIKPTVVHCILFKVELALSVWTPDVASFDRFCLFCKSLCSTFSEQKNYC
jgi:hypothetical protein